MSLIREGEELKAPRHASAAATRDGNLPIFLTVLELKLIIDFASFFASYPPF